MSSINVISSTPWIPIRKCCAALKNRHPLKPQGLEHSLGWVFARGPLLVFGLVPWPHPPLQGFLHLCQRKPFRALFPVKKWLCLKKPEIGYLIAVALQSMTSKWTPWTSASKSPFVKNQLFLINLLQIATWFVLAASSRVGNISFKPPGHRAWRTKKIMDKRLSRMSTL